MKVFYDNRQSVACKASLSPSAGKPAQVLASWKKLDITFEVLSFEPLSAADIAVAHDRGYVDDVMSGATENGFGNRDPEMAAALLWVAGSMVASAVHTFQTKETSFSPTSGAHHACYACGGDFCTFNFLVIAAIKAHQAGARRVGILDLDYHYGNGTDDIIQHLDLSFVRHYTSGGDRIATVGTAEQWLKRLPDTVREFSDVDLVIFNAGVDSHLNDPLGGMLTTEQMARRDRIVFETAHEIGVPICVSLAGGYQAAQDGTIEAVLRLHDATFLAAWKVAMAPGNKDQSDSWILW
jgi:acetoin utilization deacetylase AcuC-like enzyme